MVLVCETWLNPTVSDAMLLNGSNYRVFRKDRQGKAGGGVCAFIHNSISVSLLTMSPAYNSIEYLCLDLNVKPRKSRFCLFYRPPNINNIIPDYSDLLAELMLKVCAVDYAVHVFGDFNFPEITWDPPSALAGPATNFLTATQACDLVQLVQYPTRGENILDLVLTTSPESVTCVTVDTPFLTSDHSSVLVLLRNLFFEPNDPSLNQRSYRRGNYDGLNDFLRGIDWELFSMGMNSVQDLNDIFVSVMSCGIDMYIPVCKKRAKKRPSAAQNKLRKKRMTLYKNRKEKILEYKEVSRELLQQKRREYEEYERKIIESGDLNGLFSYARNKMHSSDSVTCLKRSDGSMAETNAEIASLFSNTFASVFTVDDGIVPVFPPRAPIGVSFDDVIFSESIVREKLRKLPPKTSRTPDEIPAIVLKKTAAAVAYPLARIFGLSFETGELPGVWRKALVVPIFKKGDRLLPSNYRPVSLTSVCCRTMESIIKASLSLYLKRHNLISRDQHGFRPEPVFPRALNSSSAKLNGCALWTPDWRLTWPTWTSPGPSTSSLIISWSRSLNPTQSGANACAGLSLS